MQKAMKKGLTVVAALGVMVEMTTASVSGSSFQTPAPTPKLSAADTTTVSEFMKKIDAYVAIHTTAEKTLPALSKDSTPQQIDQRERSLAAKIQATRTNAKVGEIFVPSMAAFIKRLMAGVFARGDAAQLLASIQDENVKRLTLTVNQRYPDDYPLTTMPPDVLQALPKLPEEMEYRFVGRHLILLDTHAHLIPDFVPDVLPVTK